VDLRIADLQRDAHLLDEVKERAQEILLHHPELVTPLIRRWLGDRESYGQV